MNGASPAPQPHGHRHRRRRRRRTRMLRLGLILGLVFSGLFALALWFFSKPNTWWEHEAPGADQYSDRPR